MMFSLVFHVISVVLAIIGASGVLFDQQIKESKHCEINGSVKTSSSSRTENTSVPPKLAPKISDQVFEAARLMETFVDVLRRFVNGTAFDLTSFESNMEDLGKQLTHITDSVTNISPCKELAEKLNEVKTYYDAMAEATENMRRHRDRGVTVIQWSPEG